MYRFIALIWNSNDRSKAASAHRLIQSLLSSGNSWKLVLNLPGLQVLHVRQPNGVCDAHVLERESGVVLGVLFERLDRADCESAFQDFGDTESGLLIESTGRRLVQRYWGHYVAFLRMEGGERCFVVRDPTGGLPCFRTQSAGINVFFSNLADVVYLRHSALSVNWQHVTAFLLHNRLVTDSTGYEEVMQLRAGECLSIATGRTTSSFYWDPVSVYEMESIEEPAEAREILKRTILECISAWGSCYGSIVHELSGGLDSSIVAASLCRNGVKKPDMLCFHYFTESSEGDERSYARAVAQYSGCELIERLADVSETTLESQLDTHGLASPVLVGFRPAPELLKERLVMERNAGAVFTGQGGDHLFQQGKSRLIAAEYVQRQKLGPRFFQILADTSRFTKESIWSVLTTAIGYGLINRRFDPYETYVTVPSFLSDEARCAVHTHAYSHPWFERTNSLPAIKIKQVFNIVDCQLLYLFPCRYAEQVHPLISQPIIECCLQIPTYVLTHGGRERGLARDAFAHDLPREIVGRRSKGNTSGYFNRLITENAEYVRELLLGGELVRSGILNRRNLEIAVSEREVVRGADLQSLLTAIRAEAWLRSAVDVRRQMVAA